MNLLSKRAYKVYAKYNFNLYEKLLFEKLTIVIFL